LANDINDKTPWQIIERRKATIPVGCIRDEHGLELDRTGSGLDRTAIFLKIGGSGLDRTDKIYCFDVIILTTSSMLVHLVVIFILQVC